MDLRDRKASKTIRTWNRQTLRACLHGGGGPQVGEVTLLGGVTGLTICDPPQDFNAKGESTRTTRFHFKTKEFILTRFITLAILPH